MQIIPHLPLWALYVQAFGTSLAALVAAGIASVIQYRQWKLAADKLRFELFDRRLSVFKAFHYSPPLGIFDDDIRIKTIAELNEAREDLQTSPFLFDSEIFSKIKLINDCFEQMIYIARDIKGKSASDLALLNQDWAKAHLKLNEACNQARLASFSKLNFTN